MEDGHAPTLAMYERILTGDLKRLKQVMFHSIGFLP
jgi:hypothetical protein